MEEPNNRCTCVDVLIPSPHRFDRVAGSDYQTRDTVTLRIDLFNCGEGNGPLNIEVHSDLKVHRRATSLVEWTAAEFSRTIPESNADWLLFADGKQGLSEQALERFNAARESRPDAAAAILPSPGFSDISRCWEQLPLQLALLLAPPECFATVAIHRTAAIDVGGFRGVDRPLWDLLIRQSFDASRIVVVPAVEPTSNQPADVSIPLPSIQPARPETTRAWLYEHISQFDTSRVITGAGNREDVVALKSGLLQLHDYLNESHDLSQTVQGEGRNCAGDYWHAIMHRREPDYSNAKYWFRRVGRHPIFDPLADRAAAILAHSASPAASDWQGRVQAANGWEPFEFVDLCEACAAGNDDALTRAAEAIQFAEMLLLIEHTYLDAEA